MKKLLTFSLLFCFCLPVFATHLKGGEIQVSPVAGKPLTYEFTVTLYADLGAGLRAWADQKDVTICLGDGMSKTATRINGNGNGEDLGNGIGKGIYKVIYTYASAVSSYKVSVAIPNRNPDVSNLPNSVQIPFYIETLFNPNIINSTPVLNNGIGTAKVKQKFTYNPKATDADGDSLAYRLTVVKSGDNSNCNQGGIMIESFKQPNDVRKEGTFKIDIRTGDLVWNAPTEIGNFSCAFVIEEWRKGVKISETVRDMEISVKDGDGTSVIIPPYEPAVSVGATLGGLALGNESTYNEGDFVIFPNPTNAKITAKITTEKPERAFFQLFDLYGRLLEEHSQNNLSTEHTQEFDLQSVASGTLIVKVEAGNQTFTKKVFKR
jgi:hypothetical protein